MFFKHNDVALSEKHNDSFFREATKAASL